MLYGVSTPRSQSSTFAIALRLPKTRASEKDAFLKTTARIAIILGGLGIGSIATLTLRHWFPRFCDEIHLLLFRPAALLNLPHFLMTTTPVRSFAWHAFELATAVLGIAFLFAPRRNFRAFVLVCAAILCANQARGVWLTLFPTEVLRLQMPAAELEWSLYWLVHVAPPFLLLVGTMCLTLSSSNQAPRCNHG